ncbi:MAG: Hsp20/alpha crystallin family protein [Roseburia lenta]|nr:Hsp20/alpha crystallin family protein [Roseburia lenta]
MLMPSIFGNDFMDDFFVFPQERKTTPTAKANLMQTDVKETETGYEVVIDLPGYRKENVNAEMKDGYLIISAATSTSDEEKSEDGKYIRRERYSGSCQRSFYVGEDITHEDIKAKFENGTLKLDIPKKEAQPKVEQKKTIAIE